MEKAQTIFAKDKKLIDFLKYNFKMIKTIYLFITNNVFYYIKNLYFGSYFFHSNFSLN